MSQKEQREGDRESLLPRDGIPRDRPWQVVLSLLFQRLFMRPRLRKSLLPSEPAAMHTLQLQWSLLTAWLSQQLALHQGCCSDGCCSNCRLKPWEDKIQGPQAPGLADNLLIQGLLLLLLLLPLLPLLVPILKAFRKRSVLV